MSEFYLDAGNRYKSFQLPGARPHYNPDRPGQVEHIFLDLNLDIPNQSFQGTCQITLNPVRSGITQLSLDAVNLNITSVQVNDNPQKFDYDGDRLIIALNPSTELSKKLLINIAYSVEKPQRGIYFIYPDKYYPNKPIQVWTQGEDEDSRFWFPCFDYPGQLSSSEIRVLIPNNLIALSNGELINTKQEGESTIFHWLQKEVHPTYLMTLAVGDFAEMKDEWQGKAVTYYVDKGREEDGKRSMGKTPQMMEFLSEKYGYTYPYPKYAQVCVDDFIFGGMENTSTTLLTDRCLLDERATIDNRTTESLVVHELAHQWFGDLVVIKHWSHAWVKEGMASYSEVMWTQKEYGKEAAAYYRLQEARSYLSEDGGRYRRPMVTNIYREAIELYDRHIYEKGSCVYHMIRAELGEELFWKAMQTFVQDNAHSTVETVDLLRAIEKSTGRNLLFLFEQYVFRGGYPAYKVAYSWDGDSKFVKLTVTQTDESNLFDLKIPIGFGCSKEGENSQSQIFTVQIKEKEQSFYFPLEHKPQYISFDVGNNYLKTVSLEYPIAELKAQLELDPDPISKIYAAEALGKKANLEAVKALHKALLNDEFWGIRVEVAKQLGNIKLNQSFEALVEGLEDKEANVRRAVVEALGNFKNNHSYKALKPIVQQGDRSYYVEAAACRVVGSIAGATGEDKPKDDKVIKLLKTVLEEKAGWNEVVRCGAIAGLAAMKTNQAALHIILEYTKLGTPQPLRLAAIRALGAISIGQTPPNIERILEKLSELVQESFFLTQVASVIALQQMETPKAITLLSVLAESLDARVRRLAEEAVAKVQKHIGTDTATQKLREELEELKKQNQQMKSRLENLEAKAKKDE
jgi:aminopeptidase N